MRQFGDNTWHRCLSGMPLQPAASATPHPRRGASLSQSRLPPRTRAVTSVTLQAPAVLRAASPGPGMGGTPPTLHPGDPPCSEAESGPPGPPRRPPAASDARPPHRPARGARPALTGLGRVAVHGIGRDVHLLHARVLPARQGPHGRCDRGVARAPASEPQRAGRPHARCGGRLPTAARSAEVLLRLRLRGAARTARTILRRAPRWRLCLRGLRG